MTVYDTDVLDLCFRHGIPGGGRFIRAVTGFPLAVWFALGGAAVFSNNIYVQLLSSSFWISGVLSLVVSEGSEIARPHSCNSEGWGMASWEAQLGYHLITMMLIDRLVLRRSMGWFAIALDVFRFLALGFFVPFWIAFNGNYTAWQVIAGCILGAAVGWFTMTWIYCFWWDRFEYLSEGGPLFAGWMMPKERPAAASEQQEPLLPQSHHEAASERIPSKRKIGTTQLAHW